MPMGCISPGAFLSASGLVQQPRVRTLPPSYTLNSNPTWAFKGFPGWCQGLIHAPQVFLFRVLYADHYLIFCVLLPSGGGGQGGGIHWCSYS